MGASSMGQYRFFTKSWPGSGDVPGSYDVAFIGNATDARGIATRAALKAASKKCIELRFDAGEQTLYIDGAKANSAGLQRILSGIGKIIIDATTLGLGEMLRLILALSKLGRDEIEFLYVEPLLYSRNKPESCDSNKTRDFQLTENCRFIGIHGFAHEYHASSDANHVFLVGFEHGRVQNAIEQRGDVDREKYRCFAIVGLPAFQIGWESNTLINHLSAFEEMNISGASVSYCQASSIREAYIKLWELYGKIGNERSIFFVSPLGTKPHIIGAILFLLETKGEYAVTSLYYDHPVAVQDNSVESGTWHHVRVEGLGLRS